MKLSSAFYILSSLLYIHTSVHSSSIPEEFEVIADEQRETAKIFGGDFVAQNEYPWYSTLLINDELQECGAILIAEDFVLTSAQCINRPLINRGSVEVGTLCPNLTGNCGQKSEVFNIKKVYVQSYYNEKSEAVALLQLDGNSTITPAVIDLNGNTNSYDDLNVKYLWSIGLGLTETDIIPPYKVKQVIGKYVGKEDCQDAYGEAAKITGTTICVKGANKGPCTGDKGGPVYDKENDVVVGVIQNYKFECGGTRYPYLSARLRGSAKFIKQSVCNNSAAAELPKFCKKVPEPSKSVPLLVEVITDHKGDEDNHFNIKLVNSKTSVEKIKYQKKLESNSRNHCTIYLNPKKCYSFNLFDAYGDGFVGGKGRGYRLIYNSEVIADTRVGKFEYIWVPFGAC